MVDYTFLDRSADADNMKQAVSSRLLDAPSEVYSLIRVPQYALITNVIVQLISPYGTTSAITVGFTGNEEVADPDAFLLSADIDPDGLILTRSLAGATGINRGGKWFDANNGVITVTLTQGNAPVTAAMRLFVEYKVVHGAV